MKVLTAAAAALLIAGAAASSLAAQAPRALTLSREESAAIVALQAAAVGPDRTAQDGALAAARAAARGTDARYAVARYQVEIGRARGDMQMVAQGVDALVDGGLAAPDELPSLLANQATRAFTAGDLLRTDRLMGRIVELQPNNAEALADYGQFKSRNNSRATGAADRTVSVALFARALAANQAAGRASPESLHRRAFAVAYDGTKPPLALNALAPQTIAFARALVAAYPSSLNWRDALLAYRELAPGDPALALDIGRLMRASQALAGERDYLEFAQALSGAGMAGEAKAVLDEGVSRGMLDAAKAAVAQAIAATGRRATADRAALPRLRASADSGTGAQARAAGDALFAFGQHAEAAAAYQAALTKGGEDPNLVGSRLGAALALAGRRPEAEAALRAVTGPRADLAGFWLVWLARRPA
jgi:tetratricopeptide (TPR) repeat protein